MDIYLLSEEESQEDFKVKVKYLYKSKLNLELVRYLDSHNKKYLYLSYNYGLIEPETEVEPYEVKGLRGKSLSSWALLVSALLERYVDEGSNVHMFYFGNKYNRIEKYMIKKYNIIKPPVVYYKSPELRMRWVESLIVEGVKERLNKLNLERGF